MLKTLRQTILFCNYKPVKLLEFCNKTQMFTGGLKFYKNSSGCKYSIGGAIVLVFCFLFNNCKRCKKQNMFKSLKFYFVLLFIENAYESRFKSHGFK